MKKLFSIAGIFLLLGACTLTTPSGTPNAISSLSASQQSFITGCDSYNALIVFMTQEATNKKLSSGQIATVNQVRQIVYPICSSPMPANVTQAIAEITAGTNQLSVIQKQLKNPVTSTGN